MQLEQPDFFPEIINMRNHRLFVDSKPLTVFHEDF